MKNTWSVKARYVNKKGSIKDYGGTKIPCFVLYEHQDEPFVMLKDFGKWLKSEVVYEEEPNNV